MVRPVERWCGKDIAQPSFAFERAIGMVEHNEQRGNDFVCQYDKLINPHDNDGRRFQDISHKQLCNVYPKSG